MLKKKNSKNYFLIIIITIVWFFLFGILMFYRQNRLKKEGVKGIGRLIEIRDEIHGQTTRKVSGIFKYSVEGKEYLSSGSIYPEVSIGNCYEIIYIYNDPQAVKIDFKKEVDCND